jgi:uncharacterized protein YjbI with pentapeptide repeats
MTNTAVLTPEQFRNRLSAERKFNTWPIINNVRFDTTYGSTLSSKDNPLDLTGIALFNVDFSGLLLCHAKLDSSTFNGCTVRSTDFSNATGRPTTFFMNDVSGTNLSNTEITLTVDKLNYFFEGRNPLLCQNQQLSDFIKVNQNDIKLLSSGDESFRAHNVDLLRKQAKIQLLEAQLAERLKR